MSLPDATSNHRDPETGRDGACARVVGEAVPLAAEPCVPAEALTGAKRQRHFRLHRQRDPLGEGYSCTRRAAHPGDSGGHRRDASARNPAIIELAAPGLVSRSKRQCGQDHAVT